MSITRCENHQTGTDGNCDEYAPCTTDALGAISTALGVTFTGEDTGGGWITYVARLESGHVLIVNDGNGGDAFDAFGHEGYVALYTVDGWTDGSLEDEQRGTAVDGNGAAAWVDAARFVLAGTV